MNTLPVVGSEVWIGSTRGPACQGQRYRFLVTAARDVGAGAALVTGHRAGVREDPYPLLVELEELEPVVPTRGILPAVGDIIRLSRRVVPGLSAGALLRVIGTRSCTIPAWTYLDLYILDGVGAPVRERSVLVPIAAIVLYPQGIPHARMASHGRP
jgi:hypothetical protein